MSFKVSCAWCGGPLGWYDHTDILEAMKGPVEARRFYSVVHGEHPAEDKELLCSYCAKPFMPLAHD